MANADTNTFQRELPVELSPDERHDLARKLARTEIELAEWRDETKDIMNARRRRQRELEGIVRDCAEAVDDGYQTRPVDCHTEYSDDGWTARVIRDDTLAVVEERTLSKDEHASAHQTDLLGALGCEHEAPPEAGEGDACACTKCGVQITLDSVG